MLSVTMIVTESGAGLSVARHCLMSVQYATTSCVSRTTRASGVRPATRCSFSCSGSASWFASCGTRATSRRTSAHTRCCKLSFAAPPRSSRSPSRVCYSRVCLSGVGSNWSSFITPTGSNTVIYSKNIHSKKHKTHKISYQSETQSSLWKSVSIYCTTSVGGGIFSVVPPHFVRCPAP